MNLDPYVRTQVASVSANLGAMRELLTEIRDLLRAERANPTPEPDLVARSSGGHQWPRAEEAEQRQTVPSSPAKALRAEIRHHGIHPSGIAPDVLDSIASAVARARDRQLAKYARVRAEEHVNFCERLAMRWLADRIEAGAVDEE